jgi:UDP-N-acetylmuramoyl-L-alanyl-D-glutamate--2,6-diaminopimelate ligase
MLLQDLLKRVDPIAVLGAVDRRVAGIFHDSRAVPRDGLFVALPGLRVDGHDFVGQLPHASAVVVERASEVPSGTTRILVRDTTRALAQLSAAWFGDPAGETFVLGITGTNGKTTTTWVVESIAKAAGWTAGVVGTTGHRLDGKPLGKSPSSGFTTPQAPQWQALLRSMVDGGARLVAAEVSSIALAVRRVDETQFSAVALTSLGRDHLDFHGDMASYVSAKARLFSELLMPGGTAILSGDDPAVRAAVPRRSDVTTWVCGLTGGDLFLEDAKWSAQGTSGRLMTPAGATEFYLPLPGRHNVSNALIAAAGCLAAGIGLQAVAEGITAVPVIPGRLESIPNSKRFAVLVDYAHTPDALDTVLRAMRELTPGRLAVVFGCGGDRDRGKRALMAQVATRLADRVYVTSDNPRSEDPEAILEDIASGLGPLAVRELDRRIAIERALSESIPGDVVLITGKGHETTQEIGQEFLPFDDRAVARAWLEAN